MDQRRSVRFQARDELVKHRNKRYSQYYGQDPIPSKLKPKSVLAKNSKSPPEKQKSSSSALSASTYALPGEHESAPSKEYLNMKEVSIPRTLYNQFQECFAFHDYSRTGLIDIQQFRRVICSLGYLIEEHELQWLDRLINSTFGGLLNFGNFCKVMMTIVLPRSEKKGYVGHKVEEAFRQYNNIFNGQKSDKIAVGDLETLMMRTGEQPLSPPMFRALLDATHVSDDYTVDGKELVKTVGDIQGFTQRNAQESRQEDDEEEHQTVH